MPETGAFKAKDLILCRRPRLYGHIRHTHTGAWLSRDGSKVVLKLESPESNLLSLDTSGYLRHESASQWIHYVNEHETGQNVLILSGAVPPPRIGLNREDGRLVVKGWQPVTSASASTKDDDGWVMDDWSDGDLVARAIPGKKSSSLSIVLQSHDVSRAGGGGDDTAEAFNSFEFVTHILSIATNYKKKESCDACGLELKSGKGKPLECGVCHMHWHGSCSGNIPSTCAALSYSSWLHRTAPVGSKSAATAGGVGRGAGNGTCYGYIRHMATQRWLTPVGFVAIPGGDWRLSRETPDAHLLQFNNSGAIMHCDSGLSLCVSGSGTSAEPTALSLRSAAAKDDELEFRMTQDGKLRHRSTGYVLSFEKKSELKMLPEASATASDKFEVVMHALQYVKGNANVVGKCIVCRGKPGSNRYVCVECNQECHKRCMPFIPAECGGLPFAEWWHDAQMQQEECEGAGGGDSEPHHDARPDISIVVFRVRATVDTGQHVVVGGNCEQLGDFQALGAKRMRPRSLGAGTDDEIWETTVRLRKGVDVEYKFGIMGGHSYEADWESIAVARVVSPRGIVTMADGGHFNMAGGGKRDSGVSRVEPDSLRIVLTEWACAAQECTDPELDTCERLVNATAVAAVVLQRRAGGAREQRQADEARMALNNNCARLVQGYKSWVGESDRGDEVFRLLSDAIRLCIVTTDDDTVDWESAAGYMRVDEQHGATMKVHVSVAVAFYCETAWETAVTEAKAERLDMSASMPMLSEVGAVAGGAAPVTNIDDLDKMPPPPKRTDEEFGALLRLVREASRDVEFERALFEDEDVFNVSTINWQCDAYSLWLRSKAITVAEQATQTIPSADDLKALLQAAFEFRELTLHWSAENLLPVETRDALSAMGEPFSPLLRPWFTASSRQLQAWCETLAREDTLEPLEASKQGAFSYSSSVVDAACLAGQTAEFFLGLSFIPMPPDDHPVPEDDDERALGPPDAGCGSVEEAAAAVAARGLQRYGEVMAQRSAQLLATVSDAAVASDPLYNTSNPLVQKALETPVDSRSSMAGTRGSGAGGDLDPSQSPTRSSRAISTDQKPKGRISAIFGKAAAARARELEAKAKQSLEQARDLSRHQFFNSQNLSEDDARREATERMQEALLRACVANSSVTESRNRLHSIMDVTIAAGEDSGEGDGLACPPACNDALRAIKRDSDAIVREIAVFIMLPSPGILQGLQKSTESQTSQQLLNKAKEAKDKAKGRMSRFMGRSSRDKSQEQLDALAEESVRIADMTPESHVQFVDYLDGKLAQVRDVLPPQSFQRVLLGEIMTHTTNLCESMLELREVEEYSMATEQSQHSPDPTNRSSQGTRASGYTTPPNSSTSPAVSPQRGGDGDNKSAGAGGATTPSFTTPSKTQTLVAANNDNAVMAHPRVLTMMAAVRGFAASLAVCDRVLRLHVDVTLMLHAGGEGISRKRIEGEMAKMQNIVEIRHALATAMASAAGFDGTDVHAFNEFGVIRQTKM